MEKSIALSAIIIMIVWFVIFLFKKYYFRHLKFHNIVVKGTTAFIEKYGDYICGWIKAHASDEDYFEKKKAFDDRYTKTVLQSQRYAKRCFLFRLIEYLFKGTDYLQTEIMIFNGDETHIINYTQEKDGKWSEEFEKSIASFSFAE